MKRKNPHAKALGTLGGKSRSKKKILAARKNGKKGGRPKIMMAHKYFKKSPWVDLFKKKKLRRK